MLKIIIDLKNSSDAHKFDPGRDNDTETELVHKRQFELVNQWIVQRLQNLDRPINISEDRQNDDRLHDTITISGTRGSGKTSFLLSLIEKYKNSDIAILKIIDPTLIEEKGHVFLNIISLIKDEVDTRMDRESASPGEKYFNAMPTWKKLMEELAHGLPSMDGVGGELTDSPWQDAEYIMQRGLRSVSSARKLEDNFRDLVKASLKILGKKAFLLVFDDIDVDFKKGWPVLETIRKYLTSPQLFTLLSGDLRLYSISIRKQQWQNFGKAILINEGEHLKKMSRFDDLTTEMEGQFLQKVLKPERRIHLTSINEKVSSPLYKKDHSIEVRTSSGETEITEFYDHLLSEYGINNPYQAEAYRSFLMSLPLRMQIRILSSVEAGGLYSRSIGIKDSFISDLYEKSVDIGLLNSNIKFLNIVILELLLKEQALNESYQLQPTTTDTSLNGCLLTLSFLFSAGLSETNPHLIFDYFIKIGTVRNFLPSLGYRGDYENQTNARTAPSVEGLFEHSGMKKDKVLRDITGLMTAYILAKIKPGRSVGSSWGGIIELKGLAKPAKRRIGDRIDTVFEQLEGSPEKTLAYFPLCILKPSSGQQSVVAYSFYNLLGSIGEMIRKTKESDIDNGLLELSQLRTYPMPDFGSWGSDSLDLSGDESPETAKTSENNDKKVEILKSIIKAWIGAFSGNAISPHLLGKIATRFFYAFDSISEGESSDTLGTAMHFRVVAFMNAVLIEEVKENIKAQRKLNINNTDYSEKLFIDNLKNNITNKENLLFSRWILSCPMLLCYLNPQPDLTTAIIEFCSPLDLSKYFGLSVFTLLEKVGLKHSGSRINNKTKPSLNRSKAERKYDDLIDFLKIRKIPFELFEDNGLAGNKASNKELRSLLPSDIMNNAFNTGGKIRAFRRHLAKYKTRW